MLQQRHSILLWKGCEDRSFNEYSKEAFYIYEALKRYSHICEPKYETTFRKEEVKQLDLNYDQFRELIERNPVDTNNIELGYHFGFFSSLKESESAGITFMIGNRNKLFINSIIIKLPLDFDILDSHNRRDVSELFSHCVKRFHPFWGCVSNDKNARSFGKYVENNKPTTVHWLNYWDQPMCNRIGIGKINRVLNNYQHTSFTEGIFKLKETPIDIRNESDIAFQRNIMKKLKLD